VNAQEFIRKWTKANLNESQGSHEHFLDLCELFEHAKPAAADPEGATYCFEKGARKLGGGDGFADVWKKGFFGWEYKGKHKDLQRAYEQLLKYKDSLENPPLLVVCDLDEFRIHTNFTNTAHEEHRFTTAELSNPDKLALLRKVFHDYEALRPQRTTRRVTEDAAEQFCRVADKLRERKVEPLRAAHFLMKLVFCLFAEDVGLLPKGIFAKLLEMTADDPERFTKAAGDLFSAMREGGLWGIEKIHHFDGGLFADAEVLALTEEELHLLAKIADLDWSNIEPAVFGTLFEKSLDPDKRSQLGAHYTSREDIETIVEPVLMAPLRREWEEVKGRLTKLQEASKAEKMEAHKRAVKKFDQEIAGFLERLRGIRILDPACGSGNFLYVSLKLLKDLEKEAITFAAVASGRQILPYVQPDQLYGIEVNPYAQELASVVVWIGYIQWYRDNGYVMGTDPVLKPLNNIVRKDAIVDLTDPKFPKEPDWPDADVIVSNPPFLGGKLLRGGLGDDYVNTLFKVYDGRVPREADLVLYWFEKARAMLVQKRVQRVGLLGTQGIRGGANRKVLERIKETGDIFFAVSDREWALDGAMLNISMIGFDAGIDKVRVLDGQPVARINADLTAGANIGDAVPLKANMCVSFMGDTKGGKFDIPEKLAREFLTASNPNGRPNSDVIKPWVNGKDVLGTPRGMSIVDFGDSMSAEEAAQYEGPFEYLKKAVSTQRGNSRSARSEWWIHERPRPDMKAALARLRRYIATTRHAKHRVFVWLPPHVLPDSALIVFAREDDYAFGVLHSRAHELWALRQGTHLQTRSRYTPTTTFETFPFPWPLCKEPRKGEFGFDRLQAISEAARELVAKRDAWLKPAEGAAKGDVRTLTALYNKRPTWLADAHAKLDRAVFAAYAWPADLPDAGLLDRLLQLNRAYAASESTLHSRPSLAADAPP